MKMEGGRTGEVAGGTARGGGGGGLRCPIGGGFSREGAIGG